MLNKLSKYADHFSFAGGNVLLASCVSKFGAEGEFNDFILGITLALFIYGFIKFVFVNALAVGLTDFSKKTNAALSVYHIAFATLGLTFFYVDSSCSDVAVFATFIISIYLMIDYSRINFVGNGRNIQSALLSVLFLLFVSLNYIASMWIGIYLLQTSMVAVLVILLIMSFARLLKSGLEFELGQGLLNANTFVYWLSNSLASHVPIIFLTFYKPQMAAGFYAIRTLFNAASTLLRPREVDFRLSLKSNGVENVLIIKFLGFAALLFFGVAALISLMLDQVLELIYSDTFGLTALDIFSFSVYMTLLWIPPLLEGVSAKLGKVWALSRIRLCDLILLIASLSFCYFYNAIFLEVVVALSLSVVPSFCLMVSIIHSNACEKNSEN